MNKSSSGLINNPSMKKRRVYIVRHGQTKMNIDDRIRSWSDVPLDPTGFAQAMKMGKELKGKKIDYIISSDLTRTLQTAQMLSLESGIPVVATTMALRPLNVGKFTGESAAKVHPMIMKHALEKPDVAFPEGESFDSFRYRCLLGTIALLNEYSDCTLCLVTHHRNDRLFNAWIEAGCPDDFELDMEHFNNKGILPGTCDLLEFSSPLII